MHLELELILNYRLFWQNLIIESLLVDWKLTVLSVFLHGSLFFKYVESNRSNTVTTKIFATRANFSSSMRSSLFLRSSVFHLLNKEFMI